MNEGGPYDAPEESTRSCESQLADCGATVGAMEDCFAEIIRAEEDALSGLTCESSERDAVDSLGDLSGRAPPVLVSSNARSDGRVDRGRSVGLLGQAERRAGRCR